MGTLNFHQFVFPPDEISSFFSQEEDFFLSFFIYLRGESKGRNGVARMDLCQAILPYRNTARPHQSMSRNKKIEREVNNQLSREQWRHRSGRKRSLLSGADEDSSQAPSKEKEKQKTPLMIGIDSNSGRYCTNLRKA